MFSEAKTHEVERYYAHNANELIRITNSILKKPEFVSALGTNIPDTVKDEFYNVTFNEFCSILNSWDESTTKFSTFLYGCLYKKFKTHLRDMLTDKRKANLNAQSLYAPIKEGSDTVYAEVIASTFDIDMYIEDIPELSDKMMKFIKSLSPMQQKIVLLLADGKVKEEICNALDLDHDSFEQHMKRIKSSESVAKFRM